MIEVCGRYNSPVLFDTTSYERLCLVEILLFAGMGLLLGGIGRFGLSGSDRWNTVMAARVASSAGTGRLCRTGRAGSWLRQCFPCLSFGEVRAADFLGYTRCLQLGWWGARCRADFG